MVRNRNPEEYANVLREIIQNDKDFPILYKKAKIQYLLNFRWYNPFSWKYYFKLKKVKEKYEN